MRLVGLGDPVAQARQVFENLRRCMTEAARPAASTAIQVAALFAPGYLLEAEAWALVDD